MRIGVIGRADPTGLGSMTADFCDNVEVHQALIVHRDARGPTDIRRISAHHTKAVDEINANSVHWFNDIDVLVGFETFYSHEIVPECARQGIKTVMFPMWECSPPELAACDLLIAVTDADKKRFPNAVRMDWPMEPMDFLCKPSNPPTNFVCNGGSLGLHNRNNFDAAVAAVHSGCFDDTNARLILRCHDLKHAYSLAEGHPKIDVLPRAEYRTELYSRSDVIIHLQAFDGLSLPQLEAAACGVPMVVMDIEGNERHPHRIKAPYVDRHDMMGQSVKYWRPDVEDLARMLRGMATGEIVPQSSPTPPTWAQFKERFYGAIDSLGA